MPLGVILIAKIMHTISEVILMAKGQNKNERPKNPANETQKKNPMGNRQNNTNPQ